MFTFDFLLTLLLVYAVSRGVRALRAPTSEMAPRQQTHVERREETAHGRIVDATFEEIE